MIASNVTNTYLENVIRMQSFACNNFTFNHKRTKYHVIEKLLLNRNYIPAKNRFKKINTNLACKIEFLIFRNQQCIYKVFTVTRVPFYSIYCNIISHFLQTIGFIIICFISFSSVQKHFSSYKQLFINSFIELLKKKDRINWIIFK